MLVLARRLGESIVIHGDIVVTLVDVGRNGQVRIGIEAPRHYQIYRQELLREIQAANHQALVAGEPGSAAELLAGVIGLTVPGAPSASAPGAADASAPVLAGSLPTTEPQTGSQANAAGAPERQPWR